MDDEYLHWVHFSGPDNPDPECGTMTDFDHATDADRERAKALAEAAGWRQCGFLYSHPERGDYRVSDMDGWIDLCDNEGIVWDVSANQQIKQDGCMTTNCDHAKSFHRYGSDEPTPDRARVADSVSVVRCECGKVCLRLHHPATVTHPGRVFAVAYLDAKDSVNISEDVLKALDVCRHNIPCSGRH